MSYTDPYSVGENERAAYDAAGSRNLIPPSSATHSERAQKGKKVSQTQWSELLQLSDIKFDEPGVKEPEEDGDATFLLQFSFRVADESEQEGARSPNSGRIITQFQRFNIPAWKRQVGQRMNGQAMMTQISFGWLKSLLKAMEIDEEYGLRPRALAEEYKSDLIGNKVWATIRIAQKGDEDPQQEITRFTSETP